MAVVHHPTIPGITQEVPAKDVKRWKRSGWVDKAPETADAIPAPENTPAPPDAANEKE